VAVVESEALISKIDSTTRDASSSRISGWHRLLF